MQRKAEVSAGFISYIAVATQRENAHTVGTATTTMITVFFSAPRKSSS